MSKEKDQEFLKISPFTGTIKENGRFTSAALNWIAPHLNGKRGRLKEIADLSGMDHGTVRSLSKHINKYERKRLCQHQADANKRDRTRISEAEFLRRCRKLLRKIEDEQGTAAR